MRLRDTNSLAHTARGQKSRNFQPRKTITGKAVHRPGIDLLWIITSRTFTNIYCWDRPHNLWHSYRATRGERNPAAAAKCIRLSEIIYTQAGCLKNTNPAGAGNSWRLPWQLSYETRTEFLRARVRDTPKYPSRCRASIFVRASGKCTFCVRERERDTLCGAAISYSCSIIIWSRARSSWIVPRVCDAIFYCEFAARVKRSDARRDSSAIKRLKRGAHRASIARCIASFPLCTVEMYQTLKLPQEKLLIKKKLRSTKLGFNSIFLVLALFIINSLWIQASWVLNIKVVWKIR